MEVNRVRIHTVVSDLPYLGSVRTYGDGSEVCRGWQVGSIKYFCWWVDEGIKHNVLNTRVCRYCL